MISDFASGLKRPDAPPLCRVSGGGVPPPAAAPLEMPDQGMQKVRGLERYEQEPSVTKARHE